MRALVSSERLVTPDGVGPGAVRLEGDRIAAVGPDLAPPEGEYVEIDAGDLVVMPGGVDVHTHLEMTVMGVRTADDWASGSRAALRGGTTTVVDFAEPGPDGTLRSGLAAAEALLVGRSMVDAGLHMTVTDAADARLAELDEVVARGQTTFKVYTAYPALMLDPEGLARVLERAAALGARVWVHCEQEAEIAPRIAAARASGDLRARQHARARPPETEVAAVEAVLAAAERAGAAVHLAHLSTAGAVERVAAAKGRGLDVTAETCPHYLWLEEHRLGWPAPAGLCHICAPPLRTAAHLHALWRGLADGVIDAVATDHCPFPWHGGKSRGLVASAEGTAPGASPKPSEDFTRVPGGLPGVETRLPLVYAGGVATGRFDLARFVSLVASGPARLAGLYPQKGALVAGADADLVLFDPEGGTSLDVEDLHMNVDHSPYQGLRAQGQVVAVIKGGELVVADGQWRDDPPPGRLLRRATVSEQARRAKAT
jgi:dihydropyrimidinase